MTVPRERIRVLHDAPVRRERSFVLYWMTTQRRTRFNPALERAGELARELARPVLVLEALRCAYPYASERFHVFLMQGMADTARRLHGRVLYHPWLEQRQGDGKGLVEELSRRACAVVTDDYPTFFLPRMLEATAPRLDVRLEAVDGSCVVPFRLAGRDFPTAFAYRRFLQRTMPQWLDRLPREDPLAGVPPPGRDAVPEAISRRWPAASAAVLRDPARAVAALPVDHRIGACVARPGGAAAAEAHLKTFLRERLATYLDARNDPDAHATSGLSPWLHFGHLSSFEVVRALLRRERWTPERLARRPDGRRAGFWGVSPDAEAFLDQIVTWRELGFVTCAHRPDHRTYESLPGWARATLDAHAGDRRPVLYERGALEAARTADPVWNVAQRQLLLDGVVHGYLRMLWGKKILEWSASAREALEIMLDLNDRYALDGRDPNSVSGIFWCLGRYDRPWGPERPVFGKVRYMSSENARRKVALERTLSRYAPP